MEWRSRLLPRYERQARAVDAALLGASLTGANQRRIKGGLAPLLRGAPLSKSAISRLVGRITSLFAQWRQRSLAEEGIAYLDLDALGSRVRLAKQVVSAPVLVALGGARMARRSSWIWSCSRANPPPPETETGTGYFSYLFVSTARRHAAASSARPSPLLPDTAVQITPHPACKGQGKMKLVARWRTRGRELRRFRDPTWRRAAYRKPAMRFEVRSSAAWIGASAAAEQIEP